MNKISVEVNGRQLQREVAPRTHLGDFLRDERASHRHAPRLRARCLWRLHRAGRRTACALLHHVRRGLRRRARHHRRRLRRRSDHDASAPGVFASSRPAMRFLHARHAGDRARHRPAPADADEAPGADRAFRQPVPVHRLHGHRCGGHVGVEGGPRRDAARDRRLAQGGAGREGGSTGQRASEALCRLPGRGSPRRSGQSRRSRVRGQRQGPRQRPRRQARRQPRRPPVRVPPPLRPRSPKERRSRAGSTCRSRPIGYGHSWSTCRQWRPACQAPP